MLARGGTFLTQQVGGDEAGEVRGRLGGEPPSGIRFEVLLDALATAGLEVVDGAEHIGSYRFVDVAALVAYAQRVPWDFPEDFTVDRYADPLLRWHRDVAGEPVLVTMRRFWLRALAPS